MRGPGARFAVQASGFSIQGEACSVYGKRVEGLLGAAGSLAEHSKELADRLGEERIEERWFCMDNLPVRIHLIIEEMFCRQALRHGSSYPVNKIYA